MASNIRLNRICGLCGKDFIAKTTLTKYCGDPCAKRAYKARMRESKIQASNRETRQVKVNRIEQKEFLTAREAAILLNCSIRSIYNYIELGTIPATNLGQRLTRIRKENLTKLFNKPKN